VQNKPGISVWTIYLDPEDYQRADGGSFYLVRRWETVGVLAVPKEVVGVSSTLEGARALIPAHLVRFDRHPDDDRTIVETWL